MTRNAIPFPLSSSDGVGAWSNSKILKSVLVDRHANTQNSRNANISPPMRALLMSLLTIQASNNVMAPEIPPEASAVLAFMPIKTTETIPQRIKNTP